MVSWPFRKRGEEESDAAISDAEFTDKEALVCWSDDPVLNENGIN